MAVISLPDEEELKDLVKGKKKDKLQKTKSQIVHFGSSKNRQYKDSTKYGLFSHLDYYNPSLPKDDPVNVHADQMRRAFKARFEKTKNVVYSASWFSDKYLW